MKDKLITLLESLKYPVYLQGSLDPDKEYPDAFFTFWNSATLDRAHYDNKVIEWVWEFDVNFYATDPALVNTILWQAGELLKQNGFIVPGKGFDLPSDEITHTGRGIEALIIERNLEEDEQDEENEDAE